LDGRLQNAYLPQLVKACAASFVRAGQICNLCLTAYECLAVSHEDKGVGNRHRLVAYFGLPGHSSAASIAPQQTSG